MATVMFLMMAGLHVILLALHPQLKLSSTSSDLSKPAAHTAPTPKDTRKSVHHFHLHSPKQFVSLQRHLQKQSWDFVTDCLCCYIFWNSVHT